MYIPVVQIKILINYKYRPVVKLCFRNRLWGMITMDTKWQMSCDDVAILDVPMMQFSNKSITYPLFVILKIMLWYNYCLSHGIFGDYKYSTDFL